MEELKGKLELTGYTWNCLESPFNSVTFNSVGYEMAQSTWSEWKVCSKSVDMEELKIRYG